MAEHLALVHYVVRETAAQLPGHVDRDQLVSAGMLGLTKAAQSFDLSRGVPFAAFARNRIRGAILDELRSVDWASRSVRSRARRRETASDELAARLGRVPTPAELATHLGMTVAELDAMDTDVHRSVVLSFQGLGGAAAVEPMLPSGAPGPEQVLEEREREAYLRDAVAVLPDRLRAVIVGCYFEDRPVAEVAAELRVTESRVSQLRAEALALLRDGLNSQLDPSRMPAADRPDGCVARRKEAYYAAVAARSDYRARLSSAPSAALADAYGARRARG